LAVEQVAQRVASGGHSIPEDVIRRRYQRGRVNLISLYLPLCDRWIIYNNSSNDASLIAEYSYSQQLIVYESRIWNQIRG
jgi:predicted ABC-type ATPase